MRNTRHFGILIVLALILCGSSCVYRLDPPMMPPDELGKHKVPPPPKQEQAPATHTVTTVTPVVGNGGELTQVPSSNANQPAPSAPAQQPQVPTQPAPAAPAPLSPVPASAAAPTPAQQPSSDDVPEPGAALPRSVKAESYWRYFGAVNLSKECPHSWMVANLPDKAQVCEKCTAEEALYTGNSPKWEHRLYISIKPWSAWDGWIRMPANGMLGYETTALLRLCHGRLGQIETIDWQAYTDSQWETEYDRLVNDTVGVDDEAYHRDHPYGR